MSRRKPAKEREIVARMREVLRVMQQQYPHNPADVEMLFKYAQVSRSVHGCLIQAIGQINIGPDPFEEDYLECAVWDIEKAETLAQNLKVWAEALEETRGKK